jgi:hypothetical protein
MACSGTSFENNVKCSYFHRPVPRIGSDVHLTRIVIDRERILVDLSLPADGLQESAILKDHVVVEAVERRFPPEPVTVPRVGGSGGKQPGPGGLPQLVPQTLPSRRD